MPQFESVEDLRRVRPGQACTLIPSWNNGFPLRLGPGSEETTGGLVRPGQRLLVLAEEDRFIQVRLESEGLVGWVPAHVVAPWPEP